MSVKKRERLYGLDILKCICSFFIVLIHQNLIVDSGYYIIGISRVAVPIFFMITGYFYIYTEKNNKQLANLKRICIITISSTSLYVIYTVLRGIIYNNSIASIIHDKLSVNNIIKWIFLNDCPFGLHLWYLYALIYCLLIVYIMKLLFPKYLHFILIFLTPFLLSGDLVLGSYSLVLLHREFSHVIVRNFLFVAIPFFTLGLWLRKKEVETNRVRNHKILVVLLIVLFTITTCLEKRLLDYYDLSGAREHYISTIFLSIIIFIMFSGSFWEGKLKLLNKIGKDYSLYIFIIHPIIIDLLNCCIEYVPQNAKHFYFLISSLLVFIISIIISILLINVKKYLNK